ncbi:ABC transporter permease [Leucobacter sp. GX24907]
MKIQRPILGSITVFVFAISLLPVPVLVWFSLFKQSYLVVPPAGGYTLDWYLQLPQQRELFGGLAYSLLLALVTAVVATLLGVLAALAIKYGRIKRTGLIENLMTLPLTVPNIVLSMALYLFLFRLGQMLGLNLAGSFYTLLAGHVLITLPWTFRLISAGVLGLSEDLERASMDLGRTRFQTFWRVSLPLLKPAIFSSAVLAFIFSFGNLEISLFLIAPGETTLPVAMMQYVATRLDPTVAAVAVVQLVLIVVLLALANKLFGFGRTFTGGLKQ